MIQKKVLRWLLQSNHSQNLSEFIPMIADWLARIGSINEAWVKPETYRLFQQHGFHLTRNHYYSILPDTSKFTEDWWASIPYQSALEKIQKADIDSIFAAVLQWADDLAALPRESPSGFYWNNDMFPPLDAMALYGMLRQYRPSKLLEIGSGFSTEIALMAARHTQTKIHCIEPYPGAQLQARKTELAELIPLPVQNVPLETFDALQPGDFLFIDTTHTVKLGSDVNHLLFNVIPRIQPGVYIHVHDIFLPYEYPRRWYDEISIFWNEQYLWLAYFLDNPFVEIILPNYWISVEKKDELRKRFQSFDIWTLTNNLGGASGASLWFRKK
ncbi:MAG: class I SAM-dependent methyltransferase [Chloroflexi bacterium]|nr:class I SAM-dependent methyltransferase [Chloroflexota bacterium]